MNLTSVIMIKYFRFFCNFLAAVLLSATLFSCTNIYYIGQTTESVKLYPVPDATVNATYTIPKGSKVLTRKKTKQFHYLIFENYNGYAYKPIYLNYHKYNSSIDGQLYGYTTKKKKKTSSYSTSNGGTVNVKGYYRKDGTYVRPHTRSAPKRKY